MYGLVYILLNKLQKKIKNGYSGITHVLGVYQEITEIALFWQYPDH